MKLTPPTTSRPLWRWLAYLSVIILLGLVFLMYFRVELVVDLASRLWSCL
ncbi:MAG: hypothetical protein KGL90_02320 [Burkholderiales bacterium]|nr:hypothetical protein [Burkholderiales bacterium]